MVSFGSTDSPCPDCGQAEHECLCVAHSLMSFLHDFRHAERDDVAPLTARASNEEASVARHVDTSPPAMAPPVSEPFGPGPWVPPAAPGPSGPQWAGQWNPPPPRVPRSWNRSEAPAPWNQGRGKGDGRLGAFVAVLVLLLIGAVAGAKLSYSPPSVPALDTLLVSPPAAQFVLDSNSPVNGYYTNAQIEKYDGGLPVPHGVKLYGRTWTDPVDRAAFISVAFLGSSVASAEAFTNGFYTAAVAQGAQPFPLTGLNGTDGTGLSAAGSSGNDVSVAVVARSRVAFVYLAVGSDRTTDQALVVQAAQSTGSTLQVDPGQPSQPPASTAPHSFPYRVGEWFVYFLLAAAVISGVVAVAGRKKKRAAIIW